LSLQDGFVRQFRPQGFEPLEFFDGAAVVAFGLGVIAQGEGPTVGLHCHWCPPTSLGMERMSETLQRRRLAVQSMLPLMANRKSWILLRDMHMRALWNAFAVTLLLCDITASQTGNSMVGIFESRGDLGVTPKTGSIEFNRASGEYRVTGGGGNIWGTEDALYFAWRRISGDVTVTADVRFIGAGAVAHRKAVLMVRQDLTPGSAYADLALHGDGLTSLQFRLAPGEETKELQSTVKGPTRIRLVRRGNSYTIFAGKPGEELTATGPQTVELKDPVYVGIGVCSHDANVLETAVFSNVQAQEQRPQAAAQRYRSKITVFDFAARTTNTIYQADDVIEAPNWSRDGKFLLVNTGGNLFKLPVNGSGEPKLEKINLGDGSYRCNNDHDY